MKNEKTLRFILESLYMDRINVDDSIELIKELISNEKETPIYIPQPILPGSNPDRPWTTTTYDCGDKANNPETTNSK